MSLAFPSSVTICIPARDELDNLLELLRSIDHQLGKFSLRSAYVVVFDDGSDDGTFQALKDKQYISFELKVLRSLVSLGKSSALFFAIGEGLKSESDVVVMMDGDGQDDPRHLGDLFEMIARGYEVVNGRRINREHTRLKRIGSRAFNGLVRLYTGVPLLDINSGYKAFSFSAASALRPYLYGELHRVILVIAFWLGLELGEVRVVNRRRRTGKSKYGYVSGWRALIDLVTIQFLRRYHSRPSHFFSAVGTLLILAGIGALAMLLANGLDGYGWVDGVFPMLFAPLALGMGGVLFSFGFLAELIVFSARAPSTYFVQSTAPSRAQVPSQSGMGKVSNGSDAEAY